jgi:hypothetical protein
MPKVLAETHCGCDFPGAALEDCKSCLQIKKSYCFVCAARYQYRRGRIYLCLYLNLVRVGLNVLNLGQIRQLPKTDGPFVTCYNKLGFLGDIH